MVSPTLQLATPISIYLQKAFGACSLSHGNQNMLL